MDTHRVLLHRIYVVVYTAVSQTSMREIPNKYLTDNCLETQRYHNGVWQPAQIKLNSNGWN
jgi:hypothetical protein